MDSFVFDSFKERFINGETPEYDTWTLWPVNKSFTADYEPVIDRLRSPDDFISYNKSADANTWFDSYKTNMVGMSYYYTKMADVDNAEQPEYVTEETWSQFITNNPGNDHLNYLFFNSASNWYRQYDVRWENVPDEYGQLVEVSSVIPRGFYFVRTKEELKWCAEKVNSNVYDNAINVVLGDNIGVLTQTADNGLTNIDFSIGSNPAQPYEGIFYGNGYKLTNINLQCKNDVNGIIGYLGTSGIISTVDIVKNNRVECHKQINMQHLIDAGTDVLAGFLCGKNDGRIEYVRILDKMTFSNFVPKIYNIQDKTDIQEFDVDNDAYPFYPDYMCYNSLGNIIPYIGYFNEGVFGTYSGYSKPDNTNYVYWNTMFYNQNPELKSYDGYIKSDTYGMSTIQSPIEWYYWSSPSSGYMKTNDAGVAHGYITYATPDCNRKNILWYDSGIIMKTKQITVPEVDGFRVVSDGILHLNNEYSAGKDMATLYTSKIEYAPYFDRSLKLSQQNRVAYYVSPIVGMNNGTIEHVREECELNTSGTFVGFMGGVAGKQNLGTVNDMIVNVSSTDRVWEPSDNIKLSYHTRNYETVSASPDSLYFTKKSIKNIGGLFGSLAVSNFLNINDTFAYLYNDNKVVINKSDESVVYDDYSFMNRFGTLAAMVEYNTTNISDVWYDTDTINDREKRTITVKNCVFSYDEGLATVDTESDTTYNFYSPYMSYYGGEVPMASDYMFGVVSPLVAEIKPTYLSSPSILSSPFFNTENIKLTATNQETATYSAEQSTTIIAAEGTSTQLYPLAVTVPGIFEFQEYSYKDFAKADVDRLGLYTIDQYLGAAYSNDGNMYSINTEIDLPGVANRKSDLSMDGIAGGQVDRLNCTAAENFDIDIRNIASRLINFENSYITNNYNMAETPFMTVTVPSAAYIKPAMGITGDNPDEDTIVITGRGVPESTSAIIGTYNANKVLMTYPYFGSDLILTRNTGIMDTDVMTNWNLYQFEYENRHFKEPVEDTLNGQTFTTPTSQYTSVTAFPVHSKDYVKEVTVTIDEQFLKGRPFTQDEPVSGYEYLYNIKILSDYTDCPDDENPYQQYMLSNDKTIVHDCSPGTESDDHHGFTDDIGEAIRSTIKYRDEDTYQWLPLPWDRFTNKNEIYQFLDKYCNGARKGSWLLSHTYDVPYAIGFKYMTFIFIPFCDEYWPYDGRIKKGYFPPYNRIGTVRLVMQVYHHNYIELAQQYCTFCRSMSVGYEQLLEISENAKKGTISAPEDIVKGVDDVDFKMPKQYYELNLAGKYKNGLIRSNDVTVAGLGRMEANWSSFNDASNPAMFDLYSQTYYGAGDYLAQNGNAAVTTTGSKKKYADYFKYTYTKIYNGPIYQDGLKYDVKFDYGGRYYAGYWFYNHDNVLPGEEYNDDMSYTPNILNIGKTVNEKCIINNHLALPNVDSFMVSSFSADDFDGLYVTDSSNLPVMYIDVGLGRCEDGTTWSYNCTENSPKLDSMSGLLLEMNSNE